MKSKESDNFRSNPESGKLTSGEPDAVKVASPVRRREWGNVLKSNALCSYPTPLPIQVGDESLGRSVQ
jgi:hypothetical protein